MGAQVWGGSVLLLRKECRDRVYRDVFTHRLVEVDSRNDKRVLPLGGIFSHLPVTLLESPSDSGMWKLRLPWARRRCPRNTTWVNCR